MKTYCNGDCNQGRTCDCGEPFVGSDLDLFLAVVIWVFVASCLGYAWGGWR